MELVYKVYCLKDPDTLEIRYIGYTKRTLSERLSGHYMFNKENSLKENWLKKLLKKGKKVFIETLHENLTLQEACDLEIYYIKLYGRIVSGEGRLVNVLPGGEKPPINKGRKLSLKTLRKKSVVMKKVWGNYSEEKKKAIVLKVKETKKKNPQVGWSKGLTKDVNNSLNISATKRTGIKRTEEQRKRISDSQIGKKLKESTKKKISVSKLQTGQLPPLNCKRVIVYNDEKIIKEFQTINDFCEEYNIVRGTFRKWVKTGYIRKDTNLKIKTEKWNKLPKWKN